jgi:hypothetical protein
MHPDSGNARIPSVAAPETGAIRTRFELLIFDASLEFGF